MKQEGGNVSVATHGGAIMARCKYCGNDIWWEQVILLLDVKVHSWRDRRGDICDDGYHHQPVKEAQ
jgi:hypothetical protein